MEIYSALGRHIIFNWTSALKPQEFTCFAFGFSTPLFQEVKLPVQWDANSLAVFYEKLKTEIQEQQKQSLALACTRISQEQLWLFHCSLGSTSGTVLLHCCCQLQDLASWLNQRQPSLAGCALQHLCQPPWLLLPPPQPSSSLCPYLQNPTRLHQLQAQWRTIHCPHFSQDMLHLQYFFLPCSQKGWILPKKKTDRKPFSLKNLLSEYLHGFFRALLRNSSMTSL